MSQRQTAMTHPRTVLLLGLLLIVILTAGTVSFNMVKSRQQADSMLRATGTARASGTMTAQTATTRTQVYATATALRALQSPYPPYGGVLVLNDPLQNNSKGYRWGEDTDDGTCRFRSGAYYIDIAESDYVEYCKAAATQFNNFAYQVQMTILKGDRGGITFLIDSTQKTLYYFGIGQDGSYVLDYFKGEKGTNLLKGNAPTLIHTGLNQPNLIAVVVIGGNVGLYVNMQFVVRASNIVHSPDSAIGLGAQNQSKPTEVVFNDAKVWTF